MAKMKAISLPNQVAKTQKVFNQFIRLRDQDKGCVSCKSHKVDHASHYYSAGKYTALRFNESNVHGACISCNYFKHGNLIPYRVNLEKRLGKKTLELLDGVANRSTKKWSITELQLIEKEYKLKIKNIESNS
jgi:hypothetical protein